MEAQQKFEIDVVTSDDATRALLTVGGEIDVGTAHEIDAVVAVVAGWSETRDVVVELSEVTFIDNECSGATPGRMLAPAGSDRNAALTNL